MKHFRVHGDPSALEFPFGSFAASLPIVVRGVRVNDYDPIAEVFDQLMAIDFHAATHAIRREVVKGLAGHKQIRCLDLCCGTGLFFSLLASEFPIQGYGIDKSRGQISVARARKVSPYASITYQVGDVRKVSFPKDVNLVTINFDALNHLLSEEEWRQILDKSRRSLTDNGVLLFDINLPERLAGDWSNPEVIVKDNLAYIQLGYAPVARKGTITRRTQMIIFKKTKRDVFARIDALVEQFSMSLSDVIKLLEGSGFRHIELISKQNETPKGHIFNKNRAFLCARK
jgi:ubiquinone/menaquinone biosynthesis C-methylase UbiE